MSEPSDECKVEKKPKKVVKKVIVKKIVKRKKADVKMENVSAPATEAPEVPEVNEAPAPVLNVDSYVRDMDDMTRKAMEIARDHLESSFNIEKSCGYLSYVEGDR
jgi:hypothetical protein